MSDLLLNINGTATTLRPSIDKHTNLPLTSKGGSRIMEAAITLADGTRLFIKAYVPVNVAPATQAAMMQPVQPAPVVQAAQPKRRNGKAVQTVQPQATPAMAAPAPQAVQPQAVQAAAPAAPSTLADVIAGLQAKQAASDAILAKLAAKLGV